MRAPDPGEARWQNPILERRPIPKGTRLAGQHRNIVPGVEHGLVTAESATVFSDGPAVLAKLDPFRIGADLDRAADGTGYDRVFVVVEAD